MSMALKVSRARAGTGPALNRSEFRGDPGFFGDIFKTVTGFISDPIGTVVDVATKFIGGSDPPPKPIAVSVAQATQPILVQDKFPGELGPFDLDIFGAGQPGASLSFGAGRNGARAVAANGKCESGFHLNRSEYVLKNGTRILKGTVCVKDRRMNPLNPKAADKAIRRVGRAKAATESLDRVTIKCRRCRKVSCECVGMKKLC